jgi:tetratricopeptide (TPR) repeat protein
VTRTATNSAFIRGTSIGLLRSTTFLLLTWKLAFSGAKHAPYRSTPRGIASWAVAATSAVLIPAAHLTAQPPVADADRLYANRSDLASARQAAELWTAALARSPKDFEAAWKLSRADYWLGGHASETERTIYLDDGVARGRAAVALAPTRPEGHFWTAANMGALAESSSRAGLKYRGPIKDELETVRRLDAAFEQGSADRALGRWYAKVPRLLGGNRKSAEAHLRESLKYNPRSTASHFFLAELFAEAGRRQEARAELLQVLDAPYDRDWDPEDQEFKAKARSLLATP